MQGLGGGKGGSSDYSQRNTQQAINQVAPPTLMQVQARVPIGGRGQGPATVMGQPTGPVSTPSFVNVPPPGIGTGLNVAKIGSALGKLWNGWGQPTFPEATSPGYQTQRAGERQDYGSRDAAAELMGW